MPRPAANATDAGVQVGDDLCVTAGTGPSGLIILENGGVLGAGAAAPAVRSAAMLPDTATGQLAGLGGLASVLLVAGGLGLSAVRRAEVHSR